MPEDLSPTRKLAEHLIGEPLDQYVASKRSARPRWSWRLIADQIAADTAGRVNVSSETLRQWFNVKDAA